MRRGIPLALVDTLQNEAGWLPAGMRDVAKTPFIAEPAAGIFSLCPAVEDEQFALLLFMGNDERVLPACQLPLPRERIAR